MTTDTNNNELLIFGVKNMAVEIFEVASLYYPKKFGKVRMVYFSETFIQDNDLEDKVNRPDYTIFFIIGFGGKNRTECIEALKKYSNFKAFSIIHPSAIISPSAKIGDGSFIQPNVTISTNAQLGCHCLVNYNASVGHDAILERAWTYRKMGQRLQTFHGEAQALLLRGDLDALSQLCQRSAETPTTVPNNPTNGAALPIVPKSHKYCFTSRLTL